MTGQDLKAFIDSRKDINRREFQRLAGITHPSLWYYMGLDIIPEDKSDTFDRLMRSKYNYDYKESKVK